MTTANLDITASAGPARFGRKQGGFTLIEVMIAVAIIGILVKLAYPAYTQSVRKSHRAEAKTALLDLAQREERYFSTNNSYTASPVALGYGAGTTMPLAVINGGGAYYQLEFPTAPTTTTYTAQATRVNAQVGDTLCGDFKIDNTGQQSVANATQTAATCW